MVLKIIANQLTVTEAAVQYGLSRRQLHRLLARYREGGIEAVDPQSRRPKTNPHATPPEVVERVLRLRAELIAHGFDAGPVTISWHLDREGLPVPSHATIHRILTRAGLITPEPRKRPRSSYVRFEAAQPNETWQSDFTHWRLADGTDAEILNWLDDHSRLLLSCTAHRPVTGDDVVTTFLAATEEHGIPASTLTDNGRVYTARFGGGRNAFEHLLPALGVKQKNGSPGHPQIQGKIERFHQTQKRWLAQQPTATTILELQTQLDRFRVDYNDHRPHRALDRATPSQGREERTGDSFGLGRECERLG
ncbi:IS481 family transposase [Microbacterium sp. Marseille-Q6648]|uniref:IS481 family transposase n=1 Tax=Microbacterium sp. Marseille-Q6648 TaxID=2937991 RepID=UPI00203DD661|nr:IS481 family transposase [Microbacterium sp. Marseille-Q6648]